jgi:hypothetical protein
VGWHPGLGGRPSGYVARGVVSRDGGTPSREG